MNQKKKRIFIYCEGVDAFIPLESMEQIGQELDALFDGDKREIRFMRKDMTDEQFRNLPEAE